MMKVLIVDLDGTTYDNSHRNHLAPKGALGKVAANWEPWHAAFEGDELVQPVAVMIRDLVAAGWLSFVITRRSSNQRHATEARLRRDNVPFHAAEFGDMHDDRPAEAIKAELVRKLRMYASFTGQDVMIMAIDDTPAVIKALEEEGVKTLQVKRPTKQVANHA